MGVRHVRGSSTGCVYREATAAVLTRATAALNDRIGQAVQVAADLLPEPGIWRRPRPVWGL